MNEYLFKGEEIPWSFLCWILALWLPLPELSWGYWQVSWPLHSWTDDQQYEKLLQVSWHIEIFYFTEIISKYSCKKTKNKQTHNQWEHSTIITKRDCYKCDKAFHYWHHIRRPQHKFTHKDGKGFWILFICLVYRISKEKVISENIHLRT